VVVGVLEEVEDATFIRLNMVTRSAFSTQEDNKIGIDDISLNLFIKIEWHIVYSNPKN
jgi:hypothetical protein